jgi:hypothetical protein
VLGYFKRVDKTLVSGATEIVSKQLNYPWLSGLSEKVPHGYNITTVPCLLGCCVTMCKQMSLYCAWQDMPSCLWIDDTSR